MKCPHGSSTDTILKINAMKLIEVFFTLKSDRWQRAMDDPDLASLRDYIHNLEMPSRSPDDIQATSCPPNPARSAFF
jgi:hypothetical protein